MQFKPKLHIDYLLITKTRSCDLVFAISNLSHKENIRWIILTFMKEWNGPTVLIYTTIPTQFQFNYQFLSNFILMLSYEDLIPTNQQLSSNKLEITAIWLKDKVYLQVLKNILFIERNWIKNISENGNENYKSSSSMQELWYLALHSLCLPLQGSSVKIQVYGYLRNISHPYK